MKVAGTKSVPTNNAQTRIYYEMCYSSEEKVAGAITIPIAPSVKVPEFKAIVLSTLNPSEVAEALRKAGQQL
jgi:hypothetical protein